MKVKHLQDYLSTLDGEALVVLSADAEGNTFNYLEAMQPADPIQGASGKVLQRVVLWPDSTHMDQEELWVPTTQ